MRYFTPLLPPGEIFQSNSISKSWKVSSVNRSSSILGCGNDLIQPSSMVKPSPGGDFLAGSSQPAYDLPSNSRRHPAAFSSAVSWLSAAAAATTAAQASAVILRACSMAASVSFHPSKGADIAHKRSIISNDRKVHPRNPCSCRPPHWRLVAARPVRPAADYYRFLPPARCPGRRVLPATCHHWRPLLEQRHAVEHDRCWRSAAWTLHHFSRVHQAVDPAGDSLAGRRLQLHRPPDVDLQPRQPCRYELRRQCDPGLHPDRPRRLQPEPNPRRRSLSNAHDPHHRHLYSRRGHRACN